jgi:hypothetical protein
MIYRVALVAEAEYRWSIFRIDRQALPSAYREWPWMRIFVATGFSADESHGQRSRQLSRTQPRLS